MSVEKNRKTLVHALADLPAYTAPDGKWDDIADRLDEESQFDRITEVAADLPLMKAPDEGWKAIEQGLDRPRRRRLLPVGWMRAAAVLTVLIGIAWALWPEGNQLQVVVRVEDQTPDPSLLDSDWDTDEEAFAEVVSLYQRHRTIFPQEEQRPLIKELEELNEARAELKDAMELYGRDATLLRELADIERARSGILKKMAQKI